MSVWKLFKVCIEFKKKKCLLWDFMFKSPTVRKRIIIWKRKIFKRTEKRFSHINLLSGRKAMRRWFANSGNWWLYFLLLDRLASIIRFWASREWEIYWEGERQSDKPHSRSFKSYRLKRAKGKNPSIVLVYRVSILPQTNFILGHLSNRTTTEKIDVSSFKCR